MSCPVVFQLQGAASNPIRGQACRTDSFSDGLTRRSNGPKVGAMLIVILLVLAGVGFYAFIGTAPQEAVQIMLVLFWGFLIIAGFLAEFFY